MVVSISLWQSVYRYGSQYIIMVVSISLWQSVYLNSSQYIVMAVSISYFTNIKTHRCYTLYNNWEMTAKVFIKSQEEDKTCLHSPLKSCIMGQNVMLIYHLCLSISQCSLHLYCHLSLPKPKHTLACIILPPWHLASAYSHDTSTKHTGNKSRHKQTKKHASFSR